MKIWGGLIWEGLTRGGLTWGGLTWGGLTWGAYLGGRGLPGVALPGGSPVYIAPPGRAERAAREQIEEAATKKERASPAELLEDVLDGCLRHLRKLPPR